MIPLRIRSLRARTSHLVEHALAVNPRLGTGHCVICHDLQHRVCSSRDHRPSLGVAIVVGGIFAHAFARQSGA
jgi:hypothetical protein